MEVSGVGGRMKKKEHVFSVGGSEPSSTLFVLSFGRKSIKCGMIRIYQNKDNFSGGASRRFLNIQVDLG